MKKIYFFPMFITVLLLIPVILVCRSPIDNEFNKTVKHSFENPVSPTNPKADFGKAGITTSGYTENNLFQQMVPEQGELDFGDNPDQPYPTLLGSDGARHQIISTIYLGNLIDAEVDGQPNVAATGDDLVNKDDEDGVFFTKPFVAGKATTIKVKASVQGYLNAWFDFNKNGSWLDPGDQVCINTPVVPGINNIVINVPAGAKPGYTYTRFRYNTTGGLNYFGFAQDGEVEDYRVIVYPPNWGYNPTNSTHLISVPVDILFNCVNLTDGDFIGTFYTNELGNLACGGVTYWDDVNNQVVVAFGDDPTTSAIKEGFAENEPFRWKVYHAAAGTEEVVAVGYSPALPNFDGKYHDNGLSALIYVTDPVEVDATADPMILCEGDEVQLNAAVSGGCPPFSFEWTSQPAGFSSDLQDPTDTPSVTTTYFVTVNDGYTSATDHVTVTVIPDPGVNCPDDFALCVDSYPVGLAGATPEGGVYSGNGVMNGVFYAGLAGVGEHTITYTYTVSGTNCSWSCEFIIKVYPIPQVDCPSFMRACEGDPLVLLNTAYPPGGEYSGVGVSFDGFDYWFDPSIGVGTYVITYCYSEPPIGCDDCCEFNFYVYPLPVVECPDDFTICIDTPPFDLTGATPPGGEYSGDGVSGGVFYPADAGAGEHIITYTYTNENTGCTNFCEFKITVIEVIVECPEDFALCVDSYPIGLAGGTPEGGTYSGTGVINNVFYAGLAGEGEHTITYTYYVPGTNCFGSCEFIIKVYPLPQVDCPSFMRACEGDPLVLLNTAYPQGGEYSGTGVYFDGIDYWFDPAIGVGTYLITYCLTIPPIGCDDCCEFNFYVYPLPVVECPDDFTICIDTPPFDLTGATPPGGEYSGDGVSGGVFYPADAGAGEHIITYTYTNPNTGCTNFCTFKITVIEVIVECPEDMAVCLDDPAFELTGATPEGGYYSGPGVAGGWFDPAVAGVGFHTITYTYVVPGTNCAGTCEFVIHVKPLPQVDCPSFMRACEGDPLVLLNTAYPQGGEYSGIGVSFDGFDYWFDPAVGVGVYVITYCFTDLGSGCTGCCEFNFYVYPLPVVECPDDFTICIDTPPFDLTGATPPGGEYSGNGVWDGVFHPADAGAGEHIITYTYTNPNTGCTNFCTFKITVIEVIVECPEDMAVCLDDPAFELTGATPEGGYYSGPGVAGGWFDPAVAGVGFHTITYTYVVPGTNCAGTCEFVIHVKPLPQVDCPSFMRACEGDPLVLLNTAYPQGGEYSGIGVSFDGFDYWFDPAVGVGVYVITYCFTDLGSGCTGCCEFNFYVYPLPVVECPDDFTICIDTPPFDLTGATPPGGEYSGDGVWDGVFHPADAGAGEHIITYTYTNPNTGCTNFCTFKITVIEVIVECPEDMAVCLDDPAFELTGATPEGGYYSGPGVAGGWFDPAVAGVGYHTITYTYVVPGTNCAGTCEFVIEVKPLPQMDCPPYMEVCLNDPPVKLDQAYPLGGNYFGPGVYFDGVDYYFNPDIGVGTYIIHYCFTGPETGCKNCCEFPMYVKPLPLVTCPDDFSVCFDTDPFILSGGSPIPGTYSGWGVFDNKFYPNLAGVGAHTIKYCYFDPQLHCEGCCTFVITVLPAITPNCPDDFGVCLNDLPFVLTGATPVGGTYSGPGVSGGIFDPAAAGVGFHTITYTIGGVGSNCYGSCEFVIEVKPLPQVDCPPFMKACEDDPHVKLDQAYPWGGTYAGPGVYFDGVDYWFKPEIGVGTYIIEYCFTEPWSGCTNCCEFNFYVFPLPVVECPEDFTVCIDTPSFDLTGATPPGGQYSGDGVWDGVFHPADAGAGEHIITYTYTYPNTGCTNFCEFKITVIEVMVECPEDMAVCLDDPAFELTGATPVGGFYSGPGVSGGWFDPAIAGVGYHTITYTYVVPGTNCTGTCEFVIHVKPLPQVDCPPSMKACIGDPKVLLNSAYPQGGTYFGPGVSFDGFNYWFDPAIGVGTYLIHYCFTEPWSGCTNCCEFNFYVFPLPVVECPNDFTVCIDTPPFDLTGATPPGGEYSGDGVWDGVFHPDDAGAGEHIITYTYTNPNTSCTNFCEFKITVIEVIVECPEDMAVCLDDPAFELTGATPVGGFYSGPGVSGGWFDPAVAGVGYHTITYTYVVPGTNCAGMCEFVIHVKPLPQVDCPPSMKACVGDPKVLLNSAYPQGGNYFGPGVSFDGFNYWFDPAIGVGTYLIHYCFTEPWSGCTNCCEFNFYVFPLPVVECPEDFTVCIDTPPFDLTGATPPGGEYSGDGVWDGVFHPADAGAGVHIITYTYTNPNTGCTNFCEFKITVIEVIVECPEDMAVCLDDPAFELTGATPVGGIYSGPGVSGGWFDPAVAGVGYHTITYTYVVPGTNCAGTCEFVIHVKPLPQVDCPPYMEVCLNDPPVKLDQAYPLGGNYFGPGVYFDGVDYYFNPDIGVGTYIIHYCFTDPDTGCKNCCEFPMYVKPLPLVTCPDDFSVCFDTDPFILSGGSPIPGTYSGWGVFDNKFYPDLAGVGQHTIKYCYFDPQLHCEGCCTFVITVLPAITPECPDDMIVCLNDAPFVLTGAIPEGGVYTGPGVADGVFYPYVAGEGFHTITYTIGGVGSNCFGSCEFLIVVLPLPQVDCPPFMRACEGDPKVLLNTAVPQGGEYSGMGVSYDGFNYWFDPAIGVGTYVITYCFTDMATNCTGCCEFNFYVFPLPVVECPNDFTICINTPPFDLTGATPPGGEYSGDGVIGGVFYPADAGPGVHIITYTYTNENTGCTNFCEFKITVVEVAVECPEDMTVCLNDPAFELTGATPEGGTYSGPGVADGWFDPAVAGVGFHTITYTYVISGTNCIGTCTFVIHVQPLPQVDCPGDFEICYKSPTILLNNAWPQGGVYSGPGVFFDNGFYWFDPSVGLGDFVITYCFTEPATGCTNCCEFVIKVYADHIIDLPQGWSGVSSYIIPDNPDILAVTYPIYYQLIQLYNYSGMYWPEEGINTLGTWDPYSGYFIKVNDEAVLPICGSEVMQKTVNLNQGWNIIPVLTSYPYNIAALFTATSGFQIAKEIAGTGIYWPAFGINSIGAVLPGKAYLVRMAAPGSITYPTTPFSSADESTGHEIETESPWNIVHSTPSSHIVVFNLSERLFENGDIIGGFTSNGLCAGIIVVDDINSPFGLSLFGDDYLTVETDGFGEGEYLTYNLYRPSTGETFTLSVTYNPEMNTGTFENNGLSEVRNVKLTSTGTIEHNIASLRIYPNPSLGLFNLDGIEGFAKITVVNTYGEEILDSEFTMPGKLDLSGKPDGIYILRVESEKGVFIEKLIIK